MEKKLNLISGTFGQAKTFCQISYVDLPEDSAFYSYFLSEEFNSKGQKAGEYGSANFTSFVEYLNDVAMNEFGAKLY